MKAIAWLSLVLAVVGCGSEVQSGKAPDVHRPSPEPSTPAQSAQLSYRGVGPLSEAQLRPYRKCSSDSECVLVDNGCCSCLSTGVAAAVRSDARDAVAANFACDEAICSGGANLWCNELSARCVAGQCTASREE